METKYILITSIDPVESEFSIHLNRPEIERSICILRVIQTTIPAKMGDSIILHEQNLIEIVDKTLNSTCVKMSHICITKIEHDYKNQNITVTMDCGSNIIGHQIVSKRISVEIRIDIIEMLQKISQLTADKSILKITKI